MPIRLFSTNQILAIVWFTWTASFCALAQEAPITQEAPVVQDNPTQDDEENLTLEERYLAARASLVQLSKEIQANQQQQAVPSVLDKRTKADQQINANPFSLAQHYPNYLLPLSYSKNPSAGIANDLTEDNVDNIEAAFQISMKIPIFFRPQESRSNELQQSNHNTDLTGLYFGFTAKSFWQVYNNEVSKPFRETNYEPEIFYTWQADLSLWQYRVNAFQIGLNHQSNGQSGLRSRSWNRVIFTALFSDFNSAYSIKTWWRLPEDNKLSVDDPLGDDNPDINDFIGRVELGYAFVYYDVSIVARLRNNLSTSRNLSSLELNVTYPITNRYDVLFQYFNGYG